MPQIAGEQRQKNSQTIRMTECRQCGNRFFRISCKSRELRWKLALPGLHGPCRGHGYGNVPFPPHSFSPAQNPYGKPGLHSESRTVRLGIPRRRLRSPSGGGVFLPSGAPLHCPCSRSNCSRHASISTESRCNILLYKYIIIVYTIIGQGQRLPCFSGLRFFPPLVPRSLYDRQRHEPHGLARTIAFMAPCRGLVGSPGSLGCGPSCHALTSQFIIHARGNGPPCGLFRNPFVVAARHGGTARVRRADLTTLRSWVRVSLINDPLRLCAAEEFIRRRHPRGDLVSPVFEQGFHPRAAGGGAKRPRR